MRLTLWVPAALLVSAVGLAGYLGAFSRVSVSEETRGPISFVYRPVQTTQPDQVSRLIATMDQMLASIEVDNRSPLQVTFADGSAQVGFQVFDVELDLALSDGTRVRLIPEQAYMVARFPGWSPLSFRLAAWLGYWKVDPAFVSYRKDHGYVTSEAMTLYDGDSILYLRPVRKN